MTISDLVNEKCTFIREAKVNNKKSEVETNECPMITQTVLCPKALSALKMYTHFKLSYQVNLYLLLLLNLNLIFRANFFSASRKAYKNEFKMRTHLDIFVFGDKKSIYIMFLKSQIILACLSIYTFELQDQLIII